MAANRAKTFFLTTAALVAGLLFAFRADLFGGSDLFFKCVRDSNPIQGWYPWSRFNLMCFREGFFPLWNPYNLLGTPHLAHYQTSVFSPLFIPLAYFNMEIVTVPYLILRLTAAGLGAYWFSRRAGVSQAGAAASAIAFGLTGCLVQNVNNIPVVIDMLPPFFLAFGLGLARERCRRDFLGFTGISLLVLLGGQPSSAIVTLGFGFSFATVMTLFRHGKKSGGLILLGLGGALALIASLIQVLPFLEFIPQGWTFHLPGVAQGRIPPLGALAFIAPGFLGPLDRAGQIMPLVQIAPYIGASVAALALTTILKPRGAVFAFLAASAVISLGLMTQAPPFNLIAALPGIDRFTLIKYLLPVLAVSLAVLAGKGVDEVLMGGTPTRLIASSVLLTAAVAGAALGYWRSIPEARIFMAVSVIVTASSIFSLNLISRFRGAGLKSLALCLLILIELCLCSTVNRPLMFRNLAREDFSAIKKISDERPLERLIIEDDLLIPNINLAIPAPTLDIADALLINGSVEAFKFMTGFSEPKLVESFLKYHSLHLPSGGSKYYTHLYGVGRRLSRSPIYYKYPIDGSDYSFSALAPSPNHIGAVSPAEIGGDTRLAFLAHAPARIDVHPYYSGRRTAAGVLDKAAGLSGDGVWFAETAADLIADDSPRLIYTRYLDPRRQPSERSWKRIKIPAKATISIVTLPASSTEHDFAAWERIHDERNASLARRDTLLNGVWVREDQPACDRGYVMAMFDGQPNYTSCLGRDNEIGAKFFQYESQKVRLTVRHPPGKGYHFITTGKPSDNPWYLVLADAYYPGWRAFLNGTETRITTIRKWRKRDHRVEMEIRGLRLVELPETGEVNTVEFVYRPQSFRIGLWSSIISILTALIMMMAWRPHEGHME